MSSGLSQDKLDGSNSGNINESISDLGEAGRASVSKTIEGGELPNGGLISIDNCNQSKQVLKNKADGQV